MCPDASTDKHRIAYDQAKAAHDGILARLHAINDEDILIRKKGPNALQMLGRLERQKRRREHNETARREGKHLVHPPNQHRLLTCEYCPAVQVVAGRSAGNASYTLFFAKKCPSIANINIKEHHRRLETIIENDATIGEGTMSNAQASTSSTYAPTSTLRVQIERQSRRRDHNETSRRENKHLVLPPNDENYLTCLYCDATQYVATKTAGNRSYSTFLAQTCPNIPSINVKQFHKDLQKLKDDDAHRGELQHDILPATQKQASSSTPNPKRFKRDMAPD